MPRIGVGCGVAPTFYGGKPFTPADLPGDVVWLRPDLDITTTADVARWLDLSGSVDHVAQDTAANKPVRYSTVGNALEFDGATEHLQGAAIASLGGAHTIGIAMQPLSDHAGGAAAAYIMQSGVAGATGWLAYIDNNTPMRLRSVTYSPGAATVTWGTITQAPQTMVFRHDGAGGNADLCWDGAHQATQAQAQCLNPATATTIAANNVGTAPMDERVWAIIAYSTRLSDAETIQLSTYLTDLRNGITPTVALPGTPVLRLERPDRYSGSHVSQLDDQLGAFDVAEAVPANRPVLIPYGPGTRPYLHFDAVNDRLVNAAFADTQATHVFVVAMPSETGVGGSYLLDGTGLDLRALRTSATPGLVLDAGAPLEGASTTDLWHYYNALYNGAASSIAIDAGTPTVGAGGAGAGTGITLGAAGDLSAFGDCRIAEVVICSTQQSASHIAALNSYFAQRYGL